MSSRVVVFLLCWSVACTLFLATRVTPFNPDTYCCDHLFYRAMAGGEQTIPPGNRLTAVYNALPWSKWLNPANGLTHQPPYVYRPLAPFMARFVGFRLLTLSSLAIAAFCLGLATVLLTRRAWLAALMSILLLTNPWVGPYYLRDYMLTDPLAYALTGIAVLLLISRKRAAFYAVALAALFTKETSFLLPLCYLAAEALDRRVRLRTVGYAAGVYGAYLAFRLVLPVPVNNASIFSSFRGVPSPVLVVTWLWQTYGALLPFALLGVLRARSLLSLLPLAGIAGLTLLWADAERTMIHAYPLVYLSAAAGIAEILAFLYTRTRNVLRPRSEPATEGLQ